MLEIHLSVKFQKKIDKRTYSPYFELINVPKRIGLENETYLAKFIRNEINSTAKSNDKLPKMENLCYL